MELLQNSLERCGYKKINKPKDDLFWSRIGSRRRRGGLQRNMSGGEKGRWWTEWRGGVVRLTDPITQLLELPFMKK